MRTLFLDCTYGVSGDMLISSLLCHLDNQQIFIDEMAKLNMYKSVKLSISDVVRYSISGKMFAIDAIEAPPARNLKDIIPLIEASALSEKVKGKVIDAFMLLGQVEAKIHGETIDNIHFHELGAVDTIFDIAGFYVLLELLDIGNIICTPINVGSGTVICSHGKLPVPVPAVTMLLTGMEVFSFGEAGEKTTPTGALLLKQEAASGQMPGGTLLSTGYGFGEKDYKEGNLLRSMIIDEGANNHEQLYLLECNIDDMTAEYLAFATERILAEGALDVWQESIYMKKNRLGTKLSVLCRNADMFADIILKHTTTLGIRISRLERRLRGESRFYSVDGIGIKRTGNVEKFEYEYLRQRAISDNSSLFEVIERLADNRE